jgi:ATP-binding cassette subfamily B protein
VTALAVLKPLLIPLLIVPVLTEWWAARLTATAERRTWQIAYPARTLAALVGDVVTSPSSIIDRNIFQLSSHLSAEYAEAYGRQTEVAIALARRRTSIGLIVRGVNALGTGLGLAAVLTLVYLGKLQPGIAGATVVALQTAATALQSSANGANLSHYVVEVDLWHELKALADRFCRPASTTLAPAMPREVALHGVSFTYPGSTRPAIKQIDLTLHSGEVVALVGVNGSGKTTLARLISGVYAPTTGSVSIDGFDIASLDWASVMRLTSMVPQAPFRWPVTFGTAIRLGAWADDSIVESDRRYESALRLSGADDVLASLPHGEATVLSHTFDGGVDLSDGQWQRIAIARAIYRSAPILIADEPTSALDAVAEARVFSGLRQAGVGGTGIKVLVTHRLATIRDVDRVVVLAAGRIVEQGTHDELIALDGQYAALYRTQADPYR